MSEKPLSERIKRGTSTTTALASFVSELFHSRTQAHIFHLGKIPYGQHIALNTYYDSIIPIVDSLVETYQGKYGIIKGYCTDFTCKEEHADIIPYFEALLITVTKSYNLFTDSNLINIVDEIYTLISQTLYKLKYLS